MPPLELHSIAGSRGPRRIGTWCVARSTKTAWLRKGFSTYWCVLRREFSGMIHFITINNNPSNPQQPIHSLHLAPVSLCSWIMIIYDNPMIIHRKYMKASRHNPTINQQWCSRMLNRRCCWKCCWNDLKLWDPLLGGSKLFTA